MRRTHAIPGRGTASRIGRPLLGSAAGHVVFLSALSLLGAATGPRGGEAIEVLLVEGATFARSASGGPVSAPAAGAEPLSTAGDGVPRAAVPAGHATASQRRPSASASPPPRPTPGPSSVSPAGADPIPAPPALSAPSQPAPPAFPAAPGHGPEAEGPVPGAMADAVRAGKAAAPVRIGAAGAFLTTETGAAAAEAGAAPSPAGAGVRRGPGPGESTGPAGGVPAGAAGDGAAGGAQSGALPMLRARIQERIVYPEEAVRRGQEGEVLLRIRIGRGGIPQEIRVARSSGARILDDAARRGVIRASPLPSRPGWIEVPVRFFLR